VRFRFRLQPALDRAAQREKGVECALAAAVAECSRETALTATLTLETGTFAAAPHAAGLHLEALARVRKAREERLAQRRLEVVRLRGELAVASRERRALELLRERRRAEFKSACAQAEERELDDINASLQARSRGAALFGGPRLESP
jgi:flagellar biosynthesis chaperone FliJ